MEVSLLVQDVIMEEDVMNGVRRSGRVLIPLWILIVLCVWELLEARIAGATTYRTSGSAAATLSDYIGGCPGAAAGCPDLTELVVDKSIPIGGSVTITDTIRLRVEQGYRLTGADSVAFSGGMLSAPPMQVFENPGSVADTGVGATEACYAEWFGGGSYGIQKCLNVFNRWDGLQGEKYEVTSSIRVGSGARVSGNGTGLECGDGLNDGILAITDAGGTVTNVNVSDIYLLIGNSSTDISMKNAENVHIHDFQVKTVTDCRNSTALLIEDASSATFRNFVIGVGLQAEGQNTGILIKGALENLLFDTGVVNAFKYEMKIDLSSGYVADTLTLMNVAFLDGNQMYASEAAIKMEQGTINNFNVIGCKSERHKRVFDFSGAYSSADIGYINIIGFHAVNPQILWSNEKSNLFSYWIGGIKCLYTEKLHRVTFLPANPSSFHITESNPTTGSMKLLTNSFQIIINTDPAIYDIMHLETEIPKNSVKLQW